MNSAFDYVQYSKYMHELLSVMDNLGNPEVLTVLHNKSVPILNQLDVAFMSNEYNEVARSTGLKINEFPMPPEVVLGAYDPSRVVDIVPQVSDMVSIRLYAHPFMNRPAWDEEREGLIKDFMLLYFNLIARVRVLRMFESRVFQDPVYPFVGNLAALMRNIGRLKAMKRLAGHTLYRMNISKFGRFNSFFGHDAADRIMEDYIRKLNTFSGEMGGVYRLGGDNYFGLIPNEMTPAVQHFFEGYTIIGPDGTSEMDIQSRAGFYRIGSNDEGNDTILGRTNSTFGKTNAKQKICFFDIQEEKREQERTAIEREFMQALKNGDVVPYYQPKVDPKTDTIVGLEALSRWIKDGEIIPPARFIPVLETNSKICILDFYILRKVCEDLAAWMGKGNDPVKVSINFSRNNLADKNFVSRIIETIDEYNVPHDLITVELTETTLESDFYEIERIARELKKNGVTVAVDDFGTGYSSLNLIKDINWDVIKIDKAFVPDEGAADYKKSLRLMYSVIHLANDLGMQSLVEGVETEEQRAVVMDGGCMVIQGYYYDRPIPKEELEAKLLGTYEGECRWHV